MDFIEITPGTSLCKDEIEAVIANKDGKTCTVRTGWNTYQSTFSYGVLLSLLKRKEENKKNEELNILKTLGTYAG